MQSRGRIIFTGNFWEYFIQSLGLLVLPYWTYWQFKYFFANMEIEIESAGGA